MNRAIAVLGVVAWVGLTLLLSQLRWFARSPMTDRLRPYASGPGARRSTRLWSAESFREVIAPLAQVLGSRLARTVGVSEELSIRLERVHSPLDPPGFRLRQLGCGLAGLGATVLLSFALQLSTLVALGFVLIGTLLGFLAVEQQLSTASQSWKRREFLELPVVAEQLAILLSTGYSLGAALQRLSTRSNGTCARDLQRVCLRIRQGVSETDALREWASVARLHTLDRLVPILAMNGETSDLGRLVSDEARNMRRDAQRELLASIEKKSQQVWIPVTVATLVPGVIFLAVPFTAALRQFAE